MADLDDHATPPTPRSRLQLLPAEIRDYIFDFLDKPDLQILSLVAVWCQREAAPRIWREVELTDCRMTPTDSGPVRTSGVSNTSGSVTRYPAGISVDSDEHDDTPLIRKLLVLAMNPWIAEKVQTVTHRCHLVPPAIFNELPRAPFTSQTLSIDPRTIRLVQVAVRHMVRVTTLRIIFGHPKLTEALLRCFFDSGRAHVFPVRRLWVENVRLNEGLETEILSHKYSLPLRLDFSGLESVRVRRVPLRTAETSQSERMTDRGAYVYARGRMAAELQNGFGGHYVTSVNTVGTEVVMGHEHMERMLDESHESPTWHTQAEHDENKEWPLEKLMKAANTYDDQIYRELGQQATLLQEVLDATVLSHRERAAMAYHEVWPDTPEGEAAYNNPTIRESLANIFSERIPSAAQGALALFKQAAPTLTSLTLDWVLSAPPHWLAAWDDCQRQLGWYEELFNLRFPNLRVFQHRNAVVKETICPPSIFLFDYCHAVKFDRDQFSGQRNLQEVVLGWKPLEFMEAHSNLQCLAWPMDQFFAHNKRGDHDARVQKVIDTLGRTLLDLRVDTFYSGHGEVHSVAMIPPAGAHKNSFVSRDQFITRFAAHMHSLKSIKVEGGMPRDERREILRALRKCPLEKIVLIGVCSPIGNTWGLNGEDLMTEELTPDELDFLEAEDKSAVHALGARPLVSPPKDGAFEPQYGWAGAAPMLHTLASYHSSTIRELKFCGYKGSAVLFDPTPITDPMLAPLKHCHKLESLILSFWLTTQFENSSMDDEIIALWFNRRDSNTTALVLVSDEEPAPESWEWRLRTRFMPEALAWRITNYVGQYLSETAKRRRGGVHVRASFCLGDWGGIFDVDCWIGKGGLGSDHCLRFKGPREEMEEGRRREKLESRRWF